MAKRATKFGRKQAEALAIQALSFIAADPERLGHFLAATGIGPAEIRSAAGEPLFLAGVLDHVINDEALLISCAAVTGVAAKDIVAARETLSGRAWERDLP